MAMPASRFLQAFQQVRAYAAEHGELPEDLRKAWERLQAAFKKAYQPADFKAALAEDRRVPDDLEEQTTSAQILLHRELARTRGGNEPIDG